MNRLQQLAGIKEITLNAPATATPNSGKVQGTVNVKLLQTLNPSLNPTALSTTISKVKNGSTLGMNDNKILAELMASLIKTSDDALLTKIFANLKQIESK